MTAIWDAITKVGLIKYIIGFSFDTTGSNTGPIVGCCKLLDGKFDSTFKLMFACRHHIFEIFLSSAFSTLLGKTGKL